MVETKFKKTEIGLIPEDWSIANWNDVFDFKSTASYSRAEINIQGNVGYMHYGDIYTKIKAILDINKFVSGYISNKQVKTYSIIKEGDLIMADASEDQSGIGKSFEVINQPHNPVISGLHTFLIREKKNCVLAKGFKAYFYFNPLIKKQYDALATGLKVYSLSKGSFNHIQIPLPTLPEQQGIAKVLSETDAWIDSLENIIAKKSQVKQGAMQMLLTPQENWEEKKLGDMCSLITKGTTPTSIGFNFTASGINFIKVESIDKSGNIDFEKIAFISNQCHQVLSRSQIHEGDILFSIAGALGRTAIVKNNICPANINQAIGIIRLNKNMINLHYLYYFLNKNDFQQMLNTISVTGAQPNLSLTNLNNFEIKFPKSVKEQTRIANLLSDMDAEIENLEKKLAKAKQLKQGMMQQLLTGKIRLINALQTS